MTILLSNSKGEWVEVTFERYRNILGEYMQHKIRDYYLVKGRVKIENSHEVGLYTKEDDLRAVLLNCTADQIREFKRFENKFIEPIPMKEVTDMHDSDMLYHIPMIIFSEK
jgi:hypothetical protein